MRRYCSVCTATRWRNSTGTEKRKCGTRRPWKSGRITSPRTWATENGLRKTWVMDTLLHISLFYFYFFSARWFSARPGLNAMFIFLFTTDNNRALNRARGPSRIIQRFRVYIHNNRKNIALFWTRLFKRDEWVPRFRRRSRKDNNETRSKLIWNFIRRRGRCDVADDNDNA